MMNQQTITIRDYLAQKNIPIIRESNGEIVIHCVFDDCDQDSRTNEGHLYFEIETGMYHCKKCDAHGNLFTLAEYLGDNVKDIFLNDRKVIQRINRHASNSNTQRIWDEAIEPPQDFPYLVKKKVRAHGIRFHNEALVIPLYDGNEILCSLQFIDANGNKQFLKGGKVAKCFFTIGVSKEKLCIAEGYATAASIFEATGYAVAIAFSASNLKATAEEVHKKFPEAELVICSDSDTNGLIKAREAAEAVGARLAVPKFQINDEINGECPSDFNDLNLLHGIESVKTCLDRAEIIPNKFQFTTLAALLNEPNEVVNWVVDGLLPSGGFSILVAKPKVGKSTLARQLALCVARGETFLGRNTTKGGVLYLSLEEKRSEVKNHFKAMGASGTEELGVYVGFAPDETHQWLETEIKRKHPVLVVVDTLFRFARVSDVNDYSKILAALDPLLALARNHSAHLMVLHHARKTPGDGADSALGSTAIFGSVDTAIVLKRGDGRRTIETQQRYGTDMEPTVLNFDEEIKSTLLGGTKEEDDTRKMSVAIYDFLKEEANRVDEPTINEQVDGRTTYKRKALRELVAKGDILRTGSGKKGDPFLYSCSLVPSIYMEQEKQEIKNDEEEFISPNSSEQNRENEYL